MEEIIVSKMEIKFHIEYNEPLTKNLVMRIKNPYIYMFVDNIPFFEVDFLKHNRMVLCRIKKVLNLAEAMDIEENIKRL